MTARILNIRAPTLCERFNIFYEGTDSSFSSSSIVFAKSAKPLSLSPTPLSRMMNVFPPHKWNLYFTSLWWLREHSVMKKEKRAASREKMNVCENRNRFVFVAVACRCHNFERVRFKWISTRLCLCVLRPINVLYVRLLCPCTPLCQGWLNVCLCSSVCALCISANLDVGVLCLRVCLECMCAPFVLCV